MDWSKGFSSIYYISVVDKNTWRDIDRIEITGGSVKKVMTGLRESATINCKNYSTNKEQLIRVWLDTKQNGQSSHTPLFTGIATSPKRDINGRNETNSLECYSVLAIASDILLPRGWYAPVEASGGELVRDLLNVTGAPISISENSPGLQNAIIAEGGETKLSMADKIIDAMGWRMYLDGYGRIFVGPIDKTPIAIFDSLSNDIIEPSISVDYDWYACPNVYRAVYGNSSAVARDDSIDSPYSTVNRGREIWMEDSNVYLNDKETLAEYARRMLTESQKVSSQVSYSRRFDPGINVTDVVAINYPEQKISGTYLITSQSIDLNYGASTSEEVMGI